MKIIKTSEALPKSGRYVLAWMEGAKIPMRAMWAAQHTLPLGDDADPEWGEYNEEKDEYFCPAGWYEMNQHEEQHWGVSGNVVAWCELPRLHDQFVAHIELAGAAPAAVAPQGEYPYLPQSVGDVTDFGDGKVDIDWGHPAPAGGTRLYSADQMRAYVDADRAARAAQPAAVAGPAREEIAALREEHGITSTGRGIKEFEQVDAFVRAVLQRWGAAPALEAPAAPADGATPGPWFVRKREVNGELRDCFVAAPDCQGLAYDACILCDDEYHDGVGRKLADCELIVAAVNQHRAALAAAPQAPAVPVAVTTHAELEKLQGGSGSMATIFPADASGFPVRLYAAPAAPAVDAPVKVLSQAARDVLAERRRQVEAEGWTPEHDDQHDEGEMCFAAAGYAAVASDNLQAISRDIDRDLTLDDNVYPPTNYPWPRSWEFKPCTPRRALVKSGALILAEIERIDRCSPVAAQAAAKGEHDE
ncbi:hypothetical protein [Delftia tsuruhatensis]|uniref:hypothetical protein n=1 Tax=Delftia tsuruhatensis TaxID=180282 RepID=UPI0023DBC17D|nr:hypothetical protein [Delftia tsuruhatensis]WEM00055.1 hypothetical protein PW274_07155 [Delftia tsuruhatensis]